MVITDELLEMGRTETGGYTKAQIELLGLDWAEFKSNDKRSWWNKRPWKKAVLGKEISDETAAMFVHLGGLSKHQRRKALSATSGA